MRYAQMRSFDISNGSDVGVSLFVQGCPFHCKDCFNPETWNFDGGKEWTDDTEETFFKLINRDYIHRITFLGGSPLCDNNVTKVLDLIKKIRKQFPDKKIWVYTGFTWEAINDDVSLDDLNYAAAAQARKEVLKYIDVLVDGSFDCTKKDLSLAFCGSSNQRIIDVKLSLAENEIILWKQDKE